MSAADRRFSDKARAWFDLLRVYNVPIPLVGMLAGAYSEAGPHGWRLLMVLGGALVGAAFTQSYNDYEDRETDRVNAPFRPLPSGRLRAKSVLRGGHVLALLLLAVSAAIEPLAALPVLGAVAFTRHYSTLKKRTALHHLMMPAALALTPLYGALIVHGHVGQLAWASSAAIFLGDINMNVVGSFKDLWDRSSQERVLPLLIGPRPAVLVALACGIAGLGVQAATLVLGLSRAGAWLPILVATALTLWSRLRLFAEPSAKVGYGSLQAGRISECVGFPALIAGVLPLDHALSLIACCTFLALWTQTILPEAVLPPEAAAPLSPLERGTTASLLTGEAS
jgi:4-hydroxybenzoate polyprenyltransferase